MNRLGNVLQCGWALAAATSLVCVCAANAGPVRYLSQDRFVLGELSEAYQVLGEGMVRVEGSDSDAAPGFGEFDGAVLVEVEPPQDQSSTPEGSGRVTASLRSSLNDSGITASGSVVGVHKTQLGLARAEVIVFSTFELDAARDFGLSFSLAREGNARGQTGFRLEPLGGGAALIDETIDLAAGDPGSGTRRGTLPAGRYRFTFEHFFGTDVADVEARTDYAMNLSLNETGANPIPLPPAAGPAAATLAGAILLRLRRR